MVAAKICFSAKDTHQEKTGSNENPALTKSNQFYIKSTPYKRSLNWNKIFKK